MSTDRCGAVAPFTLYGLPVSCCKPDWHDGSHLAVVGRSPMPIAWSDGCAVTGDVGQALDDELREAVAPVVARRDAALAKLKALPAIEETILATTVNPQAPSEHTEDRLLFIVEAANDRMQRPELYRAASEVVNELRAVRLHAEMAESALAAWKARAEEAKKVAPPEPQPAEDNRAALLRLLPHQRSDENNDALRPAAINEARRHAEALIVKNETLAAELKTMEDDRNAWQERAERPRAPETIERLAEIAHESWAGWMRWQWAPERTPEDLERWRRQAATPYADLSEREKESDRVEARKYLDAALADGPEEGE